MGEILFPEESYSIMGAAFEVYNQLGNGFLEAVYQEALGIEFQLRGIPFVAQPQLQICYKNFKLLQTYRPDYLVFDRIILELKALDALGTGEQSQVLNYLKASGLTLAILINFGAPLKLGYKRVAL